MGGFGIWLSNATGGREGNKVVRADDGGVAATRRSTRGIVIYDRDKPKFGIAW